jgi:hypothetical protein
VQARVRSIVLDSDRVTLIVRVEHEVAGSFALGEELRTAVCDARDVQVDNVYWKFATEAPPVTPSTA